MRPRLQLAQLRGAEVAANARGGRDHELARQVLKALRPEQRREELGALRAAGARGMGHAPRSLSVHRDTAAHNSTRPATHNANWRQRPQAGARALSDHQLRAAAGDRAHARGLRALPPAPA